jgi:hypothetical protein
MQCNFCHDFLYRGRKYNSRKEPMGGPNGKYLGITRLRFYIKCNQCARPVTFLTDPKNSDYEVESGATRNYEIQRDKAQQEEEDATEAEVTSKLDPMKALEDRVLDSQREMADQDNLEEIKAMNARHVQLMKDGGPLPAEGQDNPKQAPPAALTEEDEALVKSIQFGKKSKIYRLDDADEALLETKRQQELAAFETQAQQAQLKSAASSSQKTSSTSSRPAALVRIKRKAKAPAAEPVSKEAKKADLSSLLGGYGSSSSSE